MLRRSTALWLAIIVPLWIVMIACTHWEPVVRDGWGHFIWQRRAPMTWESFSEFALGAYRHNNPRLGQVATFLMFTPGPWHAIVTPLLELGTFYLLVALAIGRWPSIRRSDDAICFLVTFSLTAVCAPQFGSMLFYRPYCGNYLFGLAVDLAFLIPYRFAYAGRSFGGWMAPLVLVLGFAAGMCNEHTDPALVALAVVATIATKQRRFWHYLGIAALIAGSAALFFAPGQNIRYNGIGADTTMLGRVIERGIGENLSIIARLAFFMWPAAVPLVLAAAKRRATGDKRGEVELAIAITGVVMAMTLLVSPKIGGRLYLASCALCSVAVASYATRMLAGAWRTALALAAGSVAIYVAIVCTVTYHALGEIWNERVVEWERDPTTVVKPHTLGRSRWALEDDQTLPEYRAAATQAFSLP